MNKDIVRITFSLTNDYLHWSTALELGTDSTSYYSNTFNISLPFGMAGSRFGVKFVEKGV